MIALTWVVWIISVAALAVTVVNHRRTLARQSKALDEKREWKTEHEYQLGRYNRYPGALPASIEREIREQVSRFPETTKCGHWFGPTIQCEMGFWAHEYLDHQFVPVDGPRCPGHPNLPLGHDRYTNVLPIEDLIADLEDDNEEDL